MKTNRRKLISTGVAATAVVAAAIGGVWFAQRDSGAPQGASSRIDLLAGAHAGLPYQTDPEMLIMLSLAGGMPQQTSMELRFFDLDGSVISATEGITATLANLITGETTTDVLITSLDDHAWQLEQTTIQSSGWWQMRLTIGELNASWMFLMPDPNLTGFSTPPIMETDPGAQARLSATLNVLTNRTSLRWWEWLSAGNGSIILARFSITTPEGNEQPASFETDSLLAARIALDGTGPEFREQNPRTVTVGEEAFRYIDGATPEPVNPTRYLPIEQYDTTYAGHDGVYFGITAEIDGRSCQLVAFHLPGAIEAWFAFWIDIETSALRELFMLSVNHYMHWVYYDLDEPFEITF